MKAEGATGVLTSQGPTEVTEYQLQCKGVAGDAQLRQKSSDEVVLAVTGNSCLMDHRGGRVPACLPACLLACTAEPWWCVLGWVLVVPMGAPGNVFYAAVH